MTRKLPAAQAAGKRILRPHQDAPKTLTLNLVAPADTPAALLPAPPRTRPPTAVVVRQRAVLAEVLRHVDVAYAHLNGLIDCEDGIGWADSVAADELDALLARTADRLASFGRLLDTDRATVAAVAVEAYAAKAIDTLAPLASTALPEPVANVLRLSLEIEALAGRVEAYREAGGEGSGTPGREGGVVELLADAAEEVRFGVLDKLFAATPTAEQVRLGRILAGVEGGAA